MARASGIARDLRIDLPGDPYNQHTPALAMRQEGDVAARVQVRFEETLESLRLCRLLLDTLPHGVLAIEVPAAPQDRLGLGLVEGWRGPVMVAWRPVRKTASGVATRTTLHGRTGPLIEVAHSGQHRPGLPPHQ